MTIKNILLTMVFLYGCGLRITIKLPSIDMAWANEIRENTELAAKISKTFNDVVESCDRPVKDIDSGISADEQDLKKCLKATENGLQVYLELGNKEDIKRLLEQVIKNLELGAQNAKN